MTVAITRQVSRAMERCCLTHLPRQSIDIDKARRQHREYERTLEQLGCRVQQLPEEPELPDSVFVEDQAVVLDELAIITRPGAAERRAEAPSVVLALRPHRRLAFIEAPGCLDGGDVMVCGRALFVGLSARSNEAAVTRLRSLLAGHGYAVSAVPVRCCLHLKTAVSEVAPGRLLLNPEWVDPASFPGFVTMPVDPSEPFAANALRIGDGLVYPAAFPRTRARLEAEGIAVSPVDISEMAKAEGAVTCCSLVFRELPRDPR